MNANVNLEKIYKWYHQNKKHDKNNRVNNNLYINILWMLFNWLITILLCTDKRKNTAKDRKRKTKSR